MRARSSSSRARSSALLGAALGAAALFTARSASAGYTHHWSWHRPPTSAELDPCLAEMGKIANARRSILADLDGRTGDAAVFLGTGPFGDAGTLPDFSFNGIGENAHEPFIFPLAAIGGPEYTFVKTQWKPYDEVVVACLIVAHDHFPSNVLEITSDGSWFEEWRRGAALYEEVLGRHAVNPLSNVSLTTVPGTHLPAPPDGIDGSDGSGDASERRRNLWLSLGVLGGLMLVVVVARRR